MANRRVYPLDLESDQWQAALAKAERRRVLLRFCDGWGMGLLLLTLLWFCLVLLSGCENEPQESSRFRNGDVVMTRLDHRCGQIISQYFLDGWRYQVRFAALEITTHTRLGPDDPVSVAPYASVSMREFELMEAIRCR